MNESPEKMPAWQDISLEEIRTLINGDQIARALSLARLRYEGIKSVPTEIDAAIAEAEGTISTDAWRTERDALQKEIKELESILSQYSQ